LPLGGGGASPVEDGDAVVVLGVVVAVDVAVEVVVEVVDDVLVDGAPPPPVERVMRP
jgi:hypothetical protein